MQIYIRNNSSKPRIVLCSDQGSNKSYKVLVNEVVEITCSEELAELECAGTVLFVPTVFEMMEYTLIDDEDIKRSRKQADILYLIFLISICILTILTLDTLLLYSLLFIVVEVLILTGCYRVLKTEQRGEVVFIKR